MKTLLAIAVILLAGILALGFHNSDLAFRQMGTIDTTPLLRLPEGFSVPGHPEANAIMPIIFVWGVPLSSEAVQSVLRCYPKAGK